MERLHAGNTIRPGNQMQTKLQKRFKLYWLRENGRDAGTLLSAEGLEPAIRERVLEMAGAGDEQIALHLPFVDAREWRRRAEVLRGARLVREGNKIFTIPVTANAAIRDHAAFLCATNTGWLHAPAEHQAIHYATWRRISIKLQKLLRDQIPNRYFAEINQFEDREAAYPLLVYQASRVFHGMQRPEFTYDAADPDTVAKACRLVGRGLQDALAQVESRLQQAGNSQLARRYSPVWHEDVRRAALKSPEPLLDLLAKEAMLIQAIISLGSSRKMTDVKPFARIAVSAMRNVAGMDLRDVVLMALDAATVELNAAASAQNACDAQAA